MAITNFITVVGRLSFDPKFENKGGYDCCKLDLEVNTEVKSKAGTKTEKVYIQGTVWQDKAQKAKELKKGQEVMLSGRLSMWVKPETKVKYYSITVSDIMYPDIMSKEVKASMDAYERDDMPDDLPF